MKVQSLSWSENKAQIMARASECLGAAANGQVENFSDFVNAYPAVSQKRMFDFWASSVKENDFEDVTFDVIAKENKCVYAAHIASPIEIIIRHLTIANGGNSPKSLWCFLDDEKKAVIHFVNKGKWFAEGYFVGDENSSALHVIDGDEGEKMFIPIMFAKDISKYVLNAQRSGRHYLQDYLPREQGDLLSKNGSKSRQKNFSKEQNKKRKAVRKQNNLRSHRVANDNWDTL